MFFMVQRRFRVEICLQFRRLHTASDAYSAALVRALYIWCEARRALTYPSLTSFSHQLAPRNAVAMWPRMMVFLKGAIRYTAWTIHAMLYDCVLCEAML